MEQQMTEANEAIATWESRCSELQEGLSICETELGEAKAEITDFLRTHLSSTDKVLATYDDSYNSAGAEGWLAGLNVEALKTTCREHLLLVSQLVAKQDGDISSLFIELESLRTQIQEMDGELQAGASVELVRTQLEDLRKQMSEKQRAMDELNVSLANEECSASQLKSNCCTLEGRIDKLEATLKEEQEANATLQCELDAKIIELEATANAKAALHCELEAKDEQLVVAALELDAKVTELQARLDDDRLASVAHQGELEAQAADLETALKDERLAKATLRIEIEDLNLKVKDLNLNLDDVNASLDIVTRRESEISLELEKTLREAGQLRESLTTKVTESALSEAAEKQLEVLRSEKNALQDEMLRLSTHTSELEYDLQEANTSMQVYITKEVSDRATSMAAHALREQLHEIRKQAEADRAAFVAEKDARIALEEEAQRLRANLHALVDVTDQENDMYGVHALTIKATDKIHKMERNEISELRKSLARALEELRNSRAAERDAEERAAKAAHHVVVCEQELVAAKSDMKYLIMTMDEMRQDEASRRASMEHRIQSLENDHEVLQRFHATETDSLRNTLTQTVMEKDRTLQLLKDSEKNNAAMLYAASRDHTGGVDSPGTELAKLRIEKAQLLVAAAEEGAKTERRIREVLATELSSAETDILVEREKRLAADAAVDNMKLLVAELQSDLRTYREETRLGRTPTKMQIEQENRKLQERIETLAEESSSLRSQLSAAQSRVDSCQYQIEKLTTECRMAQASSNRLDREIRFQSEVQAEMHRMRPSSQGRARPEEDEERERKEDDVMTIAGYVR
jgi:chromosome segregation ATPase